MKIPGLLCKLLQLFFATQTSYSNLLSFRFHFFTICVEEFLKPTPPLQFMNGAFHLPSWEDSTLATELPDPSHILGNLPLPCLSFYTKDLVLQSLPSFPVLPSTVDSFIFQYLQIRLQSTVNPNLPQTPLNVSASGPRISQNKVKLFYILRSWFLPSHACFDLQLFVLGSLPGTFVCFFFFSIYEHLNHTRYIVESTSDTDTLSTNLPVGCHLCLVSNQSFLH